MIDLYSGFCYFTISIITYLVLSLYEKTNNKLYLIISFTCLWLFCGLRFYVGNDYENYVAGFFAIKNNSVDILWEPSYYAINKLFSFSNIGYIYVFLTSSLIVLIFLYRACLNLKIVKYGIFFSLILGFVIYTNNAVRQGVAMSIFLFSIKFLEERKGLKYLVCILLATSFHYTAFILLFLYPFKNIRLTSLHWVIIIIIACAIQSTGILRSNFFNILNIIPYYSDGYMLDERFIEDVPVGIGYVYRVCLILIVAFYLPNFNHKHQLYAQLFLLGGILYILSWGLHLFERIAFYLYYTNCISYAIIFSKKINYRGLKPLIMMCTTFYFVIQSLWGLEKDGAVPYRTIFFENLNQPFNNNYDPEN